MTREEALRVIWFIQHRSRLVEELTLEERANDECIVEATAMGVTVRYVDYAEIAHLVEEHD